MRKTDERGASCMIEYLGILGIILLALAVTYAVVSTARPFCERVDAERWEQCDE